MATNIHGIAGVAWPPTEAPSQVNYGGWTGKGSIRAFYEARGYDVTLLDYMGGACDSTASAANVGMTVGSGGHNHVHARAHANEAGGGCNGGTLYHDYRTEFRHMAYHVAWYLYRQHAQ